MKTKTNKTITIKIITLLLSYCLVLTLTGCSENTTNNTYQESISEETQIEYEYGGYFIMEKQWEKNSDEYKIVYSQDTNVKYLIKHHKFGDASTETITPLYNADGTLQIHEG